MSTSLLLLPESSIDATANSFASLSLEDNPCPSKSSKCVSSLRTSPLERLSLEVLQFTLLPLLSSLADISSLASTSRTMRQSCYAHRFPFAAPAVDICIDFYCPLCPMRKHAGTARGAMSLLSNFPVQRLKMHCFVTDVPACLLSLAARKSIISLDLKLTNKSFSCSLDSMLPRSLSAEHFPNIRELVLDSSHLQHVNLAGRVSLLTMLGKNLTALILSGTSSSGLFEHISKLCPNLKRLRVDRIKSAQDIASFSSTTLIDLDIRRVSFLLPPLALPSLQRLRYSSSTRLEPIQLEVMLAPLSMITRLNLEVSGQEVDAAVLIISRALPLLTHLTLEGAYESGSLSVLPLDALRHRCLHLSHLHLRSPSSVTPLTFTEEAFLSLSRFPRLTNVLLMYSDSVFSVLFTLLSSSKSLRSLWLWERKKWLSAAKWLEIQHTLSVYSSVDFPHISLALKDILELEP